MNKENEPKLSFATEAELISHANWLQELAFLESQDRSRPVEYILVDPKDAIIIGVISTC